ncbi:MAG: hypothetical protein R3E01_22310 [Pirellulaceae bacterium]
MGQETERSKTDQSAAAGTELEILNTIRAIVDGLDDLGTLREYRNRSEAVRKYLKVTKAGLEMQNRAAEIKLRVERRIGQILREIIRPGRKTYHDDTFRLDDLGISRLQSSRFQQLSLPPDTVFEQFIHDAMAEETEITTARMLRLAKSYGKSETRNSKRRKPKERQSTPISVTLISELQQHIEMTSNVVSACNGELKAKKPLLLRLVHEMRSLLDQLEVSINGE